MKSFRIIIVALTFVAISASATSSVQADDETARYVAGLRRVGLNQLLGLYCERHLADPNLPEWKRGLFAVEYATLLVDRAMRQPEADERKRTWRRARDLLTDTLSRTEAPYQRFSLRFRIALVDQTRGEWLRRNQGLRGEKLADYEEARALLASVVAELTRLDGAIEERLGQMRRRFATAAEQEMVDHLRSLRNSIALRLASTRTALARTFPADAARRRGELQQAAKGLKRFVRPGASAPKPFGPTVELCAVYRLLGRFAEAEKLLDKIDPASLTQDDQDALVAERGALLLAAGRAAEAADLFDKVFEARPNPPPRWRLSYIEALLKQADAMSRAGNEPKEQSSPEQAAKAGALQALAFKLLRSLEADYPGSWARRGELLLGEYAPRLLDGSTANLRRGAESLVHSGKHADAAEVFLQAGEAAETEGSSDEAFDLRFRAGREYERAGLPGRAARLFDDLADRSADHAEVARASLRAALDYHKAYLAGKDDADYRRLVARLGKHLAEFAAHPTVGEARYLLGSVREGKGEYAEAIEQFEAVPRNHRLRLPARLRMARGFDRWLRAKATGKTEAAETRKRALAFLEQALTAPSKDGPKLDGAARAEMTVLLAKLLLDRRVDRPADAESWLRGIAKESGVPPEWARRIEIQTLLALVRQTKFRDAERLAIGFGATPVADGLAALERLQQAALTMPELSRPFVAQVERRILEPLAKRQTEMTADQRYAFELASAYHELHVGNDASVTAATQRFERLRKRKPRDARVVEGIGLCHLRSRRYEQAIGQWRSLVAGLSVGTPSWYRAKLHLAISLSRSGQREQARRLIGQTEVLYPDLGGPELRKRFLAEKRRLDDG